MIKKEQNTKGFTLIELLVVIAIIGLLASVIIASLATAREKARDAQRFSDVNQIQTALELFYSNCRYYPADIYATTGATNSCASGAVTMATFISPIPIDPQGANYAYDPIVVASQTDGYCVGADLENDNHPDANAVSGTPCSDQFGGTVGSDITASDYVATP